MWKPPSNTNRSFVSRRITKIIFIARNLIKRHIIAWNVKGIKKKYQQLRRKDKKETSIKLPIKIYQSHLINHHQIIRLFVSRLLGRGTLVKRRLALKSLKWNVNAKKQVGEKNLSLRLEKSSWTETKKGLWRKRGWLLVANLWKRSEWKCVYVCSTCFKLDFEY